jgi:hypothetical protein
VEPPAAARAGRRKLRVLPFLTVGLVRSAFFLVRALRETPQPPPAGVAPLLTPLLGAEGGGGAGSGAILDKPRLLRAASALLLPDPQERRASEGHPSGSPRMGCAPATPALRRRGSGGV